MDIQEIYGLMERFEASAITELELEHLGSKIKLKKSGEYVVTPVMMSNVKSEQQTVKAAGETKDAANVSKAAAERLTEVKAPLVGTFYRAPSPDENPFVMVGQPVKKGDVLGIIEAMKLMNEILAPEDGMVESIQAENGSMVEYNQVLLTLSKGE